MSGTSRAALIAALLAVSTAPVASAPGRLPSADSIIAHYVEAIGGAAKVSAIRSVYIKGRYSENGVTMGDDDGGLVKMSPYFKLVGNPDKPMGEFSEGYDGSAWEYYGDPGIVLRTVGAAAAATRHNDAVMGPLIGYRDQGSTVSVLGLETIGGHAAYRLRVHMMDGFEEDEFVDAKSWLVIADRKVAPVHAFGAKVSSETRWSDFRRVHGVLFPFLSEEVDIATGKPLNEFRTTAIEINRAFAPSVFSPPQYVHTPLQQFLESLFAQRDDLQSVLWSYHDFKRANPGIDTDAGMQVIGYQILKMGQIQAAVALLEVNAEAYPASSGAAFGLGRAYNAAGSIEQARVAFQRALALDPSNARAKKALTTLP